MHRLAVKHKAAEDRQTAIGVGRLCFSIGGLKIIIIIITIIIINIDALRNEMEFQHL